MQEDNEIYSLYLEGGDYEDTLNKKKERENNEREQRRKLNEGEKKIIQDPEEEIGLGNPINDNKEGNNGEQENNQNEKEEKEEEHFENQNPFDVPEVQEVESFSEETEEDKSFNEVNYWSIPGIKPEDGDNLLNIKKAIDKRKNVLAVLLIFFLKNKIRSISQRIKAFIKSIIFIFNIRCI